MGRDELVCRRGECRRGECRRGECQTWSSISQRLYIWDYVTDFANFVMPWPDYYTIAPNIRFYVQNGAKGIFEEGAYTSSGSDMQELKSYFMSRLLWDPSVDDRTLIAEFLIGYYGAAAPYVQSYIDLTSESQKAANSPMTIGIPWTSSFLTPSFMMNLVATFQSATRRRCFRMINGHVFASRLCQRSMLK